MIGQVRGFDLDEFLSDWEEPGSALPWAVGDHGWVKADGTSSRPSEPGGAPATGAETSDNAVDRSMLGGFFFPALVARWRKSFNLRMRRRRPRGLRNFRPPKIPRLRQAPRVSHRKTRTVEVPELHRGAEGFHQFRWNVRQTLMLVQLNSVATFRGGSNNLMQRVSFQTLDEATSG